MVKLGITSNYLEEAQQVLSCEKVKEHPKRFRACTSLDIAEFEQLLPHSERSWDIFVDET